MKFEITFTDVTAEELPEIIDVFASHSTPIRLATAVRVIPAEPGTFEVLTSWSNDVRFGGIQLAQLARNLAEVRPRESGPTLHGQPVSFGGDGNALYVQIDGFDVVGLEEHEDGTVRAYPVDAATPAGGAAGGHGTTVWPVSADRTEQS
jgi:hypothetical protein